VIGPVFGLALLVVLIWALRRQTKQRQDAQQQQPVSPPGPTPPAPTEEPKGTWVFVPAGSTAPPPQTGSHPPGWSPGEHELSAQPYVSELPGRRDPAELEPGPKNV
jgi:hypothetical protein